MNLQTRIRQWLGITDITSKQSTLDIKIDQALTKINAVQSSNTVANRAMARIIAKLDPLFPRDEISPERKAESDKITEMVMKKLIGEHLASCVPGDPT